MTRIGSLCSGYGGLEAGLQMHLGPAATVAWHVEYDAAPSRILAHHHPDTPNYGDVKLTDWERVEPVDWLTAGYPCQPFSVAGKRKASDDPRHLWPAEPAVRGLRHRPRRRRDRALLAVSVRGDPMTRTGPDCFTRQQVRDRDQTCVICDEQGEQIHHRRPRGLGGTSRPNANSPANLILLCSGCHRLVESLRKEALDRGLLLPQSVEEPSAAPLVWHGRTVLLHDDGSVEDVTPDWGA